MNYPWKELSPKDPLSIQQTCFISDIDKKVVTFLYQPIIGPYAYSLYMTLLADFEGVGHQKTKTIHSEFLSVLGLGIPDFYQARSRLEGIGLLNTYLSEENGEKEYIYEPLMPVTSEQFFHEDLLRMLLREHVGETKLHSLQKKFSYQQLDSSKLKKITKSFLNVYEVATSIYPLDKQEGYTLISSKTGKAPLLKTTTFNHAYLKQLLQSEFFTSESLTRELRHTIEVLHQLYGIDEQEMSQLILRASNLETGSVDIQELENLAADTTNQPVLKRVLKDKLERGMEQTASQLENRRTALVKGGYSRQEVELVLLSEKLSPYSFIANIKAQKKGEVTSNEKRLLNFLLSQYKMSTAVLNMLIYYVLVIQDEPTINKGKAETIANDWMQSNVSLPEEAINKTKQFVGQRIVAAEKRSVRQYGKNVVRKVETLPEWAKEESQPKEERLLSEEERRRFNERLEKFRGGRKAGDD